MKVLMFTWHTKTFIHFLNTVNPDITSLLMLLVCAISILGLLRFFGLPGLYTFMTIAVICGNIQVLKAVKFSYFPEPIALGTIVFAATYLCTDIMTEYYGQACARRGVWLSFMGMLISTCFMLLTLGWPPIDESFVGESADKFRAAHEAMRILFSPGPAIFVSSLSAYMISQYNDIWIFHMIGRLTNGRMLWLRTNIATMLSAFVDNTIFGVLAWIVFASKPMDFHTFIFSYIFGTYIFRVVLSVINTPIMYLSRYCLPADTKQNYTQT
jgi:uncharacterized integral membrane protein (TIGR00697 family)